MVAKTYDDRMTRTPHVGATPRAQDSAEAGQAPSPPRVARVDRTHAPTQAFDADGSSGYDSVWGWY